MLFSRPKLVQQESQYTPVKVGFSKGASNIHEFFVFGTRKSEDDGPEKILQIMQNHRGKLISVNAFPSPESSNDFIVSCIIDSSKLDCNLDDLLIILRKLRCVRRAERSKLVGNTFSNFLFPLLIANNRRSIIYDAESLLSIERSLAHLPDDDEKVAASAMFEEGRAHGRRVFAGYILPITNGTSRQDENNLEAIKGFLRASGWGIFAANLDREIYTATLTDAPVLDTNGSFFAGGSYLQGLVAGLLESKSGLTKKLTLTHQAYDKDKRVLSIYYGTRDPGTSIKPQERIEQVLTVEEALEKEQVVSSEQTEPTSDEQLVPMSQAPPQSVNSPKSPSLLETSMSLEKVSAGLGDLSKVKKILNLARTGVLKVSLMHSARLTMAEASEYLQNLLKADLLEARRVVGVDSNTYYTTQKGLDYLEVQEKLEHMLNEDVMGTKAIRTALQ